MNRVAAALALLVERAALNFWTGAIDPSNFSFKNIRSICLETKMFIAIQHIIITRNTGVQKFTVQYATLMLVLCGNF